MSRSRRYIAGLSSGYAVTLVTLAVGLWLTPFTLDYLDRERYALFALTSDTLMLLGLIDLGITASLRVHASRLEARSQGDLLNVLVSSAFFAQLGLVACVLTVGLVIAWVFPGFFNVSSDLVSESRWLVALLTVSSAISVAAQPFSAILVAQQQIHIDNALQLLNIVLRTVITVIMLVAGFGVLSLAVSSIAAKMLSLCLAYLRVARLLPGSKVRWRNASWPALVNLSQVGLWLTVGGIGMIAFNSLNSVLTGKLISVEGVATMALTSRVYLMATGFLVQITDTARPMLGQLIGQEGEQGALRVHRQLVRLSGGVAIAAVAALWAANPYFLTWWVGESFYGGMILNSALALNLLMQMWIGPHRAVLTANLIVRPHAIARLIEGTLATIFGVLLGREFGMGGIALGATCGVVLTSLWYVPFRSAKMFKQSFLRSLIADAGPLIVMLPALGLIGALLSSAVRPLPSFWAAACSGAGVLIAGLLMLWFMGLENATRARIRVEVRHLLRARH